MAASFGPRRRPSMRFAEAPRNACKNYCLGCVSELVGPALSPCCWKSLCCSLAFGSTCPCTGFEPSFVSFIVGDAVCGAGVVAELGPAPELVGEEAGEEAGDGDVRGWEGRSHAASSTAAAAMTARRGFIWTPG